MGWEWKRLSWWWWWGSWEGGAHSAVPDNPGNEAWLSLDSTLLRLVVCKNGLGGPSHEHQSDWAQRGSWLGALWPGVPAWDAGGILVGPQGWVPLLPWRPRGPCAVSLSAVHTPERPLGV